MNKFNGVFQKVQSLTVFGLFMLGMSLGSVKAQDKADGTIDQDYYKISSMEVVELESEAPQELENFVSLRHDSSNKGLSGYIMAADQLIALGQKVWTIVEKGRPVVSSDLGTVSVLPEELRTNGGFSARLSGWSAPKQATYRVVYKNLYGMEVVNFKFTIHFQYNGQYQGKGRYISGATMAANNLDVAWGYSFNAKSEVVSITNRGSEANPVAGLTLRLSYAVSTVLKDSRSTYDFHLTGTGGVSGIGF